MVRAAAILWDEFDQMNWKGKAARFAAFTQGALGSEQSGDVGLDGGAAACAAAIGGVDVEIRELSERLRVLGERKLELVGQLQDTVNEECDAEMQQQDAVMRQQDEWEQLERLGRWQDAVNASDMTREEAEGLWEEEI